MNKGGVSMPIVQVEWLKGRADQVRDDLAKKITEAMVETAKVKPEQINIIFKENPVGKMYKAGKHLKIKK